MPFLSQDQTLSDRFRLLSAIGQGGMGEVWRAWDSELQDQVALKIIRPELADRPSVVDLLKQECRNARRLVHPNIVRVYDFHRAAGHAFISMEFVDGHDFARLRNAPPPAALEALLPILDALAYAHGMGIIHRDVKASNALVDPAGTPRLVDFGIAAALNAGGTLLRTGGSPHSMSPQQRAGEPPTPADDIYACGALLHELLTGQPPSAGTALASSRVPPDLVRIVQQCLAESPGDRPRNADTLRQMLAPLAASDTNATIPPLGMGPTSAAKAQPEPSIVPQPRLARPAAPEPHTAETHTPRRKTVSARVIAPLFALLAAAALVVFIWLPDYTAERRRQSAPPETVPAPERAEAPATPEPEALVEETTEAPPASPQASVEARRSAEKALADFLKAHGALEEKSIALWGGADYALVQSLAAEADTALTAGDHASAESKYREATELLGRLAGQTDAVLADSLARGAQALERGDGEAARAAFQVALAIDPDNAAATAGMARAERVEEVFRLLETGQAHEAEGRLAMAHTDYQAAASLDPASANARQALDRIQRAIAEDKFRSAMSRGLQGLEQRDFPAALAAFRVARAFQPDSREVNDGIAQATEGIRLNRIAAHRRRAASLEKQERWTDAAAEYQRALAIDPTLSFAQEGRTRSLHLAELTVGMQHYLDNRSLLTSRRVREEVEALMGRAAAVEPKSPAFARQLADLRMQLELAIKPLPLELVSDDATDVVIYRIGKLGRFKNRQLSLRPGTYTIVGSRPGYKDVRREIRLIAGKTLPPVFIACQEAI